MSDPRNEVAKWCVQFNESKLIDLAKREEKELKKIEQKASNAKQKTIYVYIKKACELCMESYSIMGSRLAIDCFNDDSLRKHLNNSLTENVFKGLGVLYIGLQMEEKHFQDKPHMADAINSTMTTISHVRGFIKSYVNKMDTGWNNKGAKAMMNDITDDFEHNVAGYLANTLLNNLQMLKSDVNKFKKRTEARLAETKEFAENRLVA
ncbi:MAG: hypothetical protein V1729_02255 [Candidatus Woesearchaeota archaeon]